MSLPSLIQPVADNGYRWWYVDAISDDSRHALTAIVFIGSVFSPWYAWKRRTRKVPALDHCSINLALYSPQGRWCMTERNSASVLQSADRLQIGPSALRRLSDTLQLDINEWCVPLPRRMRGRLDIDLPDLDIAPMTLDSSGHHQWQPVAPRTRIKVHMDAPDLHWSGTAYVDSNAGSVPLEQTFRSWNWSRSHPHHSSSRTVIRYDVSERGQAHQQRTFEVDGARIVERPAESDVPCKLASTFWFRVPRHTRRAQQDDIRNLQTLEDTPFYSRSRYEEREGATRNHVVHESLYLDRFDHPITRLMLPFRMPRIAHPVHPERVKNHA